MGIRRLESRIGWHPGHLEALATVARSIFGPCRGADDPPALWERLRRRRGRSSGRAAGRTTLRPSWGAGDIGAAVLRAVARGGRPPGPLEALASAARPIFGPLRGADDPPGPGDGGAAVLRAVPRCGRPPGPLGALAAGAWPFFGPCRGATTPPALWERRRRRRDRSSGRAAGRTTLRPSRGAGNGGAAVLWAVPRGGRPLALWERWRRRRGRSSGRGPPSGERAFLGTLPAETACPVDAKRRHRPALATASHGRLATSEGRAVEEGLGPWDLSASQGGRLDAPAMLLTGARGQYPVPSGALQGRCAEAAICAHGGR